MSPDPQGDVSFARVAVGRFVLDVGEHGGAVIQQAAKDKSPQFRPRETPVLVPARPMRGLVGRQTEFEAALSAIDAGIPVELSGEPGIGKTAVLRHLAHHPRTSLADGTVFIPARHFSFLDLRKRIFDAFCVCETQCWPTDAEIRRSLQATRALILLDDIRLARHEIEELFDLAPGCAFVVATRARCLFGEVRSVPLSGLAAEDAMALLERDLERALDGAEHPAAGEICAALGGHPLRIRQAATIIGERGIPLDRWRDHLAPDTLIAELLTAIDDGQRRVLLALAALPTVSLDPRHVTGIAEITDVESRLAALARRRLVVSHASRYRLADGVGDQLRKTGDLKPSLNRAVTYFTGWADRHRRNQEQLLDACDALVRVQEHAISERRWGETLRLGKQLERPLVAGGRWGAWQPVLERSLVAARALGDRSVEAWALHQLGTRAVCLDDPVTARRLLGQAVSLRTELGETGAAALSRRNLEFILPIVVEAAVPERPAAPFAAFDYGDSPTVRYQTVAARPRSRMSEVGALLITFLMCVALVAFAYSVIDTQDPGQPVAAAAETTPPPADTPADPARPTPIRQQAPEARRANIRIFTARPGSIVTRRSTDLCYAVTDAVRSRIEPAIGSVEPLDALTCRRVAPARTTTYELTAVGGDGIPVSQQVVIVVR